MHYDMELRLTATAMLFLYVFKDNGLISYFEAETRL